MQKIIGQLHLLQPWKKKNIIKGREPGVFDPEGKVTRAEMAAMLVRAYNLKSKETGTSAYKIC